MEGTKHPRKGCAALVLNHYRQRRAGAVRIRQAWLPVPAYASGFPKTPLWAAAGPGRCEILVRLPVVARSAGVLAVGRWQGDCHLPEQFLAADRLAVGDGECVDGSEVVLATSTTRGYVMHA